MFHALPAPLNYIVPFVIVLGVLVFVHELGHYLAARWRGVHVEAFSIGFGRALASWTDRRGTAWKIAWIPLGGYVKLHGQEQPSEVGADVRALWQPGRTFHEKGVVSRAIIIAAGPIANFLLAAVLFAGLCATLGQPVALDVVTPVIEGVMPDSAAARAGLQPGDRIVSIDGTPVARFEDVQHIVSARPAEPISLQIHRGDADQTVQVTTGSRDSGGHAVGVLGVTAKTTDFRRLSLGGSVIAGVQQTWDVAGQTLQGLWQMISARGGAENLGGPLRIAQLSGEVAQLGVASLVSFIAVLSVNLGLLNLFPIPILDGGHLLFYFAEAIRGRPLPPRAVEYGLRFGLGLLACLFVFATWNDLAHLGLVRWVAHLIG